MPDRLFEVVSQLRLLDWNRLKLRARTRSHFTGDFPFVITRLVKGERKCLDGRVGISSRKTKRRAGVQAAAKVAAYRHIGPHPQAHRLFEDRSKLFDVRAFIAPLRRKFLSRRVIKFPITEKSESIPIGDEIMACWHLLHPFKKIGRA